MFERVTVDDAFVDEELSEACGVTVTGTAQGHITLRTFPGEGPGLATVNTINVGITADRRRPHVPASGTSAPTWPGSSPTGPWCC